MQDRSLTSASGQCQPSDPLPLFVDNALSLLRAGFSVLPACRPDHVGSTSKGHEPDARCGKRPLVLAWQRLSSEKPSEDEVRRWGKRWPHANVGIVLGTASGCIAWDEDGPEGTALLRDMLAGDPPDTLWFATPGGGFRRFYSVPSGFEIPTTSWPTAGRPLTLQGNKSYTNAPGSLHPNGHYYQWPEGVRPGVTEIAPATPGMLDIIRALGEKKTRPVGGEGGGPGGGRRAPRGAGDAIKYVATCPDSISGEGGNFALFHALYHLAKKGFATLGEMREAAHWFNANKCDPPWPEGEVERVMTNAVRYACYSPPAEAPPRSLSSQGPRPYSHSNPADLAEAPAGQVGQPQLRKDRLDRVQQLANLIDEPPGGAGQVVPFRESVDEVLAGVSKAASEQPPAGQVVAEQPPPLVSSSGCSTTNGRAVQAGGDQARGGGASPPPLVSSSGRSANGRARSGKPSEGEPPPQPAAEPPPLETVLAADVADEPLEWLWHPYVPKRMLTAAVGLPDAGKSTCIAWLMTRARHTILLAGEEHLGAQVVPRLTAHGVDRRKVDILLPSERNVFPMMRDGLLRLVKQKGADLLVIDPIDEYLPPEVSDNDNLAVRKVLAAVRYIAEQAGIAVVICRHPGKAFDNVMAGSRAWRAVFRSILEFVRHPGPPRGGVLTAYRPAPGTEPTPRRYYLDGPELGAKTFRLGGCVSEAEVDALKAGVDRPSRNKMQMAIALARDVLADGSEQDATLLLGIAKRYDMSGDTMTRALESIGAKWRRDGGGPGSRIVWWIPPAGDTSGKVPDGEA